jgi:hypothetical protein
MFSNSKTQKVQSIDSKLFRKKGFGQKDKTKFFNKE